MRIEGTLTKWNDDRGFGFITPAQGGQEVFAHVSAFPRDGRRPAVGEKVTFEVRTDEKGKPRATNVLCPNRPAVQARRSAKRSRERERPGFLSRVAPAVVVAAAIFFGASQTGLLERTGSASAPQPSAEASLRQDEIGSAFASQRSDIQVTGEGTVTKLLADDHEGDRHQRFILALPSGQTLLVAHNIDLAPRLDALRQGDVVAFNGVYEWNAQGGVIHWTHHDPGGRHQAGWLRHAGRTYQ